MDEIIKTQIIELLKGIVQSKIGEKVEQHKMMQKVDMILEYIDNLLQKESDVYIRQAMQEYFREKCEIEIFGKNDIDEAKVEQQIEDKYGVFLRNESKEILISGVNYLQEQINNLLSPGEKIILSSQKEMMREITDINTSIHNGFSSNKINDISVKKKVVQDDIDKYKRLWNSPLFMEDDAERKLSDIFVKTNFAVIKIYKREFEKKEKSSYINHEKKYIIQYMNDYPNEENPARALKVYASDIDKYSNLNDIIKRFMKSDNKVSIIMGLPGSGKSSLVAYLAGNYFVSSENVIFVTLSKIKQSNSLLESICNYLNVDQYFLEDKILVLDGLDEIGYINNTGSTIINFINDVKNTYMGIKIFITVRKNYIDIQEYAQYLWQCYIIEIVNFGLVQIIDFHNKYTGKIIPLKKLEVLKEELEVLGIPLILYIVYSLKIDILSNEDIYKLYEKIFSIQSGIYDKCNDGKGGYDSIGGKFTIEDKESFHTIAQVIAYEMFIQNTLMINESDVEKKIFDGGYTSKSKNCYLYNNFYTRVEEKIGFIHKSFYEFFLAEYIGNQFKIILHESISEYDKFERLNKIFCQNKIEKEVYMHLRNKLYGETYLENVDTLIFISRYIMYIIFWGGGYESNKKMGVLKGQACLFFNVLKFICVISQVIGKEIELEKVSLQIVSRELVNIEQQEYLEPHLLDGIYFKKMSDSKADMEVKGFTRKFKNIINIRSRILIETSIRSMNFINSEWKEVFLNNSIIEKCRFENCDLRDSDFRWCKIFETEFVNTCMKNSNFRYAFLDDVNFRGSDLKGADFSNCYFNRVQFDEHNIYVIENLDIDKSAVNVFVYEKRQSIAYNQFLTLKGIS